MFDGVESLVAGEIPEEVEGPDYPRKKTRSMGRVALLATWATERALTEAGLLDHEALIDGTTGISYGSTEGNEEATDKFFRALLQKQTIEGIKSVDFLKLMSHTCAANLSQFFNVKGRIVPTSSACTSGSQGIGYGYEAIRTGRQDVMIAGGAEELVVSAAAVFNILFEASTRNEDPARASRPFDADRDGLVVAEGAGTLILEELDHARARGAPIRGEIVGFASNANGTHMAVPSEEAMVEVQKQCLQDAGIPPREIDYVNAHATATRRGDVAESRAIREVFDHGPPVSTLKGHTGHTLGACGAVEAVYCLHMMREGWFSPTLNLTAVDPECAELNYVRSEPVERGAEYVMSNNFAFGGVNTSLIFRHREAGG